MGASNPSRPRTLRRVAITALATVFALALAASASAEPRIVGGSPADISQVPWQVAVAVKGPQSGAERLWCGGSLVAPTLVISAAHCYYDYDDPPDQPPDCTDGTESFNLAPSNWEVFTGRTTLSSTQGQVIDVAEIYYFDANAQPRAVDAGNGLFNCTTDQWDVVLLQLASPSNAPTIHIAGADERLLWVAGQPALISGWGSLSAGGPPSDALNSAQVQVISDPTCVSKYAAAGGTIDPQTMVCAGLPAGGVDTCQGDSGGPLAASAEIGSSLGHRLVGDTSFGSGCGKAQFPGVYGRIADEPMRGAIASAAQQIAGANIVGSGARPVAPPQTKLRKHPTKHLRTGKRRIRVTFTFKATEPASFRCKLDRKPRRRCRSPFKARVTSGRHKFSVVATDKVGTVDDSPAKFRWRVERKRLRH